MATFAKPSGAPVEAEPVRRVRMSDLEVERLRAATILVMYERGWSLRALAKVFGVSSSTIFNDLRAIPPEAASRLRGLAGGFFGRLPNPDGLGPAKGRRQLRLAPQARRPVRLAVRVPFRENPSPEARRLAAEAAIDARCLEALERSGGRVGKAARELGVAPKRVRAALSRAGHGNMAVNDDAKAEAVNADGQQDPLLTEPRE